MTNREEEPAPPEPGEQPTQAWLIRQRQLMDAQRQAEQISQISPPGYQPQQSYPQSADQWPNQSGAADYPKHVTNNAPVYPNYPPQADNQFARRVMSGGAHVIVAGVTLFFLFCFIIGALASGVPFVIIAAIIGGGIFIMLEIYGIVTFVRGIIVHSLPQIVSGGAIVVTCLALPILFYLMILFSALHNISNYYPSSNPFNPYAP